MTPHARFLIPTLLALAVILLSPFASAGMVWGMKAWALSTATNSQGDIYVTTPEAVFKIRNNDTVPQASVESMGENRFYRPIAASLDGSRVAVSAADCTEDCPYDRVLLTDGDLNSLRVFDLRIPAAWWIKEGSLYLSDDGSRLYARTEDGITAVRTVDGSVLWSVSCGGPNRVIVSLVYSSATDRVGYSCATGTGPYAESMVSIVDGSLGVPLWGQTSPGLASISMSPSGHWIQVKSSTGVSLFEYPSLVPDLTWDHGEVLFLSDDDRFVHFESQDAEGDFPNNNTPLEHTFEWYKPPGTGALPELIATKSFVGGAVFSPLAKGSNFLIIHVDLFERGMVPEWQQHYNKYGDNTTHRNHTFYRFDRDGALLETGNARGHGSSRLHPIPNSLDAIVHDPWVSIIMYEPDVTNTRPLFMAQCDWEGNTATANVHDPDGDNVKLYWNLSAHHQLGVVLSTKWVDATGPSVTLEEGQRQQVSVVAVDEHGASSHRMCGKSDPSPRHAYEIAGVPSIWVILTAMLLISTIGGGVHRTVRRS